MRLKKGDKVEVFNKREVPSGSWWCAEIIYGNGHTYVVSYDRYQEEMGSCVERVPRKAIRPRPPPVEGTRCWVPGDIVEVCENYSWKLGEILRSVGRSYFFVRFLGSAMESRLHMSAIRMRQSWQDNKWIVIGKDSSKRQNGAVKENDCARDVHLTVENENTSQFFSKGTKKRMCASALVETSRGAGKRIRTINDEGRNHRSAAANSPVLPYKVDAVASPLKMLGEKYMHASLDKRTGYSGTQGGDGIITNSDGNLNFRVNTEPSDTESTTSSVGSCSGNSSPGRSAHCSANSLSDDMDSCSGDSETYYLGREPAFDTKEASTADIHQLELHAYRTTLMALYASGPISWDQEALMSNLRSMLHISNDEHLLELRSLVSGEKDASFR